ncbi:hypothetical protein QFX18_20075 [Saccharophagus degradans]|uniref:hypothetical protein n=1 Tax=Saccharophagus degradans TaxID=86304 RepID=UPI002478051E|nr:hypothetical protein [Saccharophagus degradans]WGO98311.1 hypothetical protein QFX18_20075 [Saccharophagus degradans]
MNHLSEFKYWQKVTSTGIWGLVLVTYVWAFSYLQDSDNWWHRYVGIAVTLFIGGYGLAVLQRLCKTCYAVFEARYFYAGISIILMLLGIGYVLFLYLLNDGGNYEALATLSSVLILILILIVATVLVPSHPDSKKSEEGNRNIHKLMDYMLREADPLKLEELIKELDLIANKDIEGFYSTLNTLKVRAKNK